MSGTATEIVIDASVALAWCFPDQESDYADQILTALEDRTALVPSIWAFFPWPVSTIFPPTTRRTWT